MARTFNQQDEFDETEFKSKGKEELEMPQLPPMPSPSQRQSRRERQEARTEQVEPQRVYLEREITLSLLNDKVNHIIALLEKTVSIEEEILANL